MNKSKGEAQVIRNESLAGIAVMNERLMKAEEILANISAPDDVQLLTFEGTRFTMFAALSEDALDGLSEFQTQLEKDKIRYSLALSVPVARYQTEPMTNSNGSVQRDFCSSNGLPVRTQSQEMDGKKDATYKYVFKRPSFWVIRVIVDASNVTFYGTLFGQYKNAEGNLEYRPVTKKVFDQESNSEIERPITKSLKNPAEGVAEREFNINGRFLFAMVKPCIQQAETARRRNGLRDSVNRASVSSTPLTTSLGETFPGLESLKSKLQEEEAPAKPADKPAKKDKKSKKAEPVAAE